MLLDLDDKDLKLRFLFGVMTDEERTLVEERFMSDPNYFDSLCALEREAIELHLRGELPSRWREGFKTRVLDSPARRARVDEAAAFVSALKSVTGHVDDETEPTKRSAWWTVGVLAACAVVVAAILVNVIQRQGTGGESHVRTEPGPTSPAPGAVATFVLLPGLTRAELRQANIFSVPGGTRQIVLELIVPAPPVPVADVQASVRPVGGAVLATPIAPEVQHIPEGLRFKVRLPAESFGRGDYLLALSRRAADGTRETFASRFFTIDE